MGCQGFPPDTAAWQEVYGPQVAEKLKADENDCQCDITGLHRVGL